MSLCLQNVTTSFDSNVSADYLYPDLDFAFEAGFSLDNIVTSARERAVAPSPVPSSININVDLFKGLELSTTLCKRKRSETEIDIEETLCILHNKKRCNNHGRPLAASFALSPYNFNVNVSIDYLVRMVNESLSLFDVCVYELDAAAFQWHVTFMGCNGYCNFTMQIFELYQHGTVGYSVEGTFLSGDGSIFEMVFDQISDRVQNLPPLHYSLPVNESTIFALYSGSLNKEKLSLYCDDLMIASTSLVDVAQEQYLLAKIVHICSLLDACRNVPAMKALFDQCHLFRALVCSAETFADANLRCISLTTRWILVYILRCLAMLTDFDSQYAADIKCPGNKYFRSYLVQLTQYAGEPSAELKLLDKFGQSLLSLCRKVMQEPTKMSLCIPPFDTPQFKQITGGATPLLAETRYLRSKAVTPTCGISCSG